MTISIPCTRCFRGLIGKSSLARKHDILDCKKEYGDPICKCCSAFKRSSKDCQPVPPNLRSEAEALLLIARDSLLHGTLEEGMLPFNRDDLQQAKVLMTKMDNVIKHSSTTELLLAKSTNDDDRFSRLERDNAMLLQRVVDLEKQVREQGKEILALKRSTTSPLFVGRSLLGHSMLVN